MTKQTENKIMETVPFVIAAHRNKYKYLRTNIIKEAKDSAMKILRHQRRKLRKMLDGRETAYAHGSEELLCCDHPSRMVYRVSASQHKFSCLFFTDIKEIQKFMQSIKDKEWPIQP